MWHSQNKTIKMKQSSRCNLNSEMLATLLLKKFVIVNTEQDKCNFG